ncbi:MAG: YdcF family protein [Acidobacteria bacterium]|nr:YdcF family protein [Acidobacteriota bacterium]
MKSARRLSRGFTFLPLILFVAFIVILWWQRHAILAPAGTWLDIAEPPRKADVALVLAGGWQGERVLYAGELVRQGYVPYVLLSGPMSYYEQPECNYAIPFAVQHGLPAAYFQCVPNASHSTEEEAAAMLPELQRRGVKRVLIVSVRTHMRRARAIFSRIPHDGVELFYVSAENRAYRLQDWYKTREGRKAVLLEWLKLATSSLGVDR